MHRLALISVAKAAHGASECRGGFDGTKTEEADIALVVTSIIIRAGKCLCAILRHQDLRVLIGDLKNGLPFHTCAE